MKDSLSISVFCWIGHHSAETPNLFIIFLPFKTPKNGLQTKCEIPSLQIGCKDKTRESLNPLQSKFETSKFKVIFWVQNEESQEKGEETIIE